MSTDTNTEKSTYVSNAANRRARRYKKYSTGRKVGRGIGRVLLVIFTFLLAVVLALGITIKMICSDSFPSAQKMFVTTVLESGQLKFLAGLFLSPEQVQAIVDENSMKELNAEVNTDLISFDNSTNTDQKDIEVEEVAGATYTGTMMIIKDPSRLSVASIYPWKAQGIPLEELCLQDGAIAGINGGLYNSHNNSGGNPYGVLVSHGEIQYNKPWEWPGLVLIGFTEDNILEIIDINGYKQDQVEALVKERKIRDAVTFQEEASDSNNHFVQLIINGESREMNGQGSGLNPRTARGQRADGSVLLFVTDGRGKAGHLGASSGDLISVMEQYGAVNAANLDGGSSSCMWYNGEYLMTSVTFYYSNSSWKLPAGFVVH
jgi:exopolysaccharide biosynthesis protein